MTKKIKKNYPIIIITFLLLFIVHIPLLTKNILTADVLLNNYFYKGYSWEISLGRFGLYVIGMLKNYMSTPIIDLIPSFIILSITTYFLIDLFEIKNKLNILFTILIMVVSPIISMTLIFYYCAIGYLISFLCGVLSTYIFYKVKNKYIKNILPIILIVISLSMYQAYLSLIITVFVLYNIKLILNKKYNYKDVINYLILLFIGVITYFILMKLSLLVFHINPSNYSNADKVGIKTILSFPSKFVLSYKLFFEFFFKDNIVKNSYFHTYIYSIILFILMIINVTKSIIKNRIKTSNIMLIIILLLLLPVFLNSVIFVINDAKLQLLMSASYIIIPIFILSFDFSKIYKFILIIVFTILIRNYYIQDQATYISLENTFNSYNTIISKAITIDGDYKYMIIGNINNKDEINKLNYGYISDLGIFWEEYNLKKIGFTKFIKIYYGKNIEFIDEENYNNLVNEEYKDIINYRDNVVVIDFDNR